MVECMIHRPKLVMPMISAICTVRNFRGIEAVEEEAMTSVPLMGVVCVSLIFMVVSSMMMVMPMVMMMMPAFVVSRMASEECNQPLEPSWTARRMIVLVVVMRTSFIEKR